MIHGWGLALIVALGLLIPAVGSGAPTLADPVLSPTSWSASPTGLVGWNQVDFGAGLPGSAVIETNTNPYGGDIGAWVVRAHVDGPLTTGSNGIPNVAVDDLEGEHRIRVRIDGAQNSPLDLGILRLDRTAPAASRIRLTQSAGVLTATWAVNDFGSRIEDGAPAAAEINMSPDADASGVWRPFAEPPGPGEGDKVARTPLGQLAEGRHLVRARIRDRAGNEGVHDLGVVHVDRTAPTVRDVRLLAPLKRVDEQAYLTFTADDGTGTGVGEIRVGPVGRGDEVNWALKASAEDAVFVRLPGAGVHAVTVRVLDRHGNRAESAPVGIRVPTPSEAADFTTTRGPRVSPRPVERLGPHVAWAVAQARRFHRERGLRLTARVRVARSTATWRRLLRTADARRYTAYSNLGGRILIGPAATRGLEALRGGGRERGARALSRADADQVVFGLAVLLHETLHETGPMAREDVLGTVSGRAFEEGFTESAAVALLPRFVAGLELPAATRSRLVAAVGRYRPGYRARVGWAERMSALATGAPAGSARARAWRVRVADRWGADRWALLAAATGLPESDLRADAAGRSRA